MFTFDVSFLAKHDLDAIQGVSRFIQRYQETERTRRLFSLNLFATQLFPITDTGDVEEVNQLVMEWDSAKMKYSLDAALAIAAENARHTSASEPASVIPFPLVPVVKSG